MRKMELQLFASLSEPAGKIKRELMAHFVNASAPGASGASYEWLGDDLEEYNVEMNANVETKNNIKGKTSVTLDSYQPQASVEPYCAVKGAAFFDRLQTIVDERLTLDDLKTDVVEAHLWDPVTGSDDTYVAYRESAIIEVSSYGGDTTGYQIPFNLHYLGDRVKGKFNIGTLTFTADGAASE